MRPSQTRRATRFRSASCFSCSAVVFSDKFNLWMVKPKAFAVCSQALGTQHAGILQHPAPTLVGRRSVSKQTEICSTAASQLEKINTAALRSRSLAAHPLPQHEVIEPYDPCA